MKITRVDVFVLDDPDKAQWYPIWVRIHTDEGIYGDGEAGLAYGVASSAAFGMVKDYAALVIGDDPLDHEIPGDKLDAVGINGDIASLIAIDGYQGWTLMDGMVVLLWMMWPLLAGG